MYKQILGLAGAAALLGTSAYAADLAPAPMYTKAPPMIMSPQTWTGFYIGGDLGGLWSRSTASWDPLPSAAFFGVNPTGGDTGGSSFVGGVHLGYNYQFTPSWVVGLEGDWSWTHASGSNTQPWTVYGTGAPVGGGAATSLSSSLDWLASVRGRVGYLITPTLMAYGTGGAAWGRVHDSATASDPTTGYLASTSFGTTGDGFVVGGGVEWALTPHWSVRGEYLYYHLYTGESVGAGAAGFPATPSGFNWSNTSVSVARGGLSYKF
jgi:outer membrane immunogenic protein